jgi:hypothetical protein
LASGAPVFTPRSADSPRSLQESDVTYLPPVFRLVLFVTAVLAATPFASAQHRVLVEGNGKLAIVDARGQVERARFSFDAPSGGDRQ